MKHFKIGKRSNSGTLCVSISQEMVLDGFALGTKVEWAKENGAWICKKADTANKPQEAKPEPSSPAAAGTE